MKRHARTTFNLTKFQGYIIGVDNVLTSNKGVNWFRFYVQTEKQPYISVSSFDTRVTTCTVMHRYVKTKASLELTLNETAQGYAYN